MYQDPRFSRGGFRGRPYQNFNNQRGFKPRINAYAPRPNRGWGPSRGGYPGQFRKPFRGGGQQPTYERYGYEEEQQGQFARAESSYVKTDTYYTSKAAKYTTTGNSNKLDENVEASQFGDHSSTEKFGHKEKESEDQEETYDYEAEAAQYGFEFGQGHQGDNDPEDAHEEQIEDNSADAYDNGVEGDNEDSNQPSHGDQEVDQDNEDSSSAQESSNKDPLTEITPEAKTEKKAEEVKTETVKTDLVTTEGQGEDKVEGTEGKEEEEEEDSSSDEDTGFCKYCKISFQSAKAYHTHTRGLQHATLVMDAKAKKGNKHYQKEKVDPEVLKVVIPAPKPFPESPQEEEEEEDFENVDWEELGMDEETKQYFLEKRKRKPEDRDLKPDDIGRKQFNDKYTCPLCVIKCTGAASFKMHVEGKQHKTNLEQAQKGGPLKKKKTVGPGLCVESCDLTAKITEKLKQTDQPIIGLEYVTEFQKPDRNASPRFVCNLCQSKCDLTTVIPHLTGLKHRLKYFQEKKPAVYEHLTKYTTKKKRSEMNYNADDFARDVEDEMGRQEVKVKVELPGNEEDLEETMQRTSQALKEAVKDMEWKNSRGNEIPEKRPRYDYDDRYDRYGRGQTRDDRYERPRDDRYGRAQLRDDRYERPRDDRYGRAELRDDRYGRAELRDDRYGRAELRDDRYERGQPRDYYRGGYPDMPYADHYRKNPYDAEYRDRFRYTHTDPYYDRMLYDERQRLDTFMERRYRLEDPLLERQRVDDILARREYLDRQDQARVDDIMERRRHLQPEVSRRFVSESDDVDYERLKRFEKRALPSESTPSSKPQGEDRPRLEELLARRKAMDYGDRPRLEDTESRARAMDYGDRPKLDDTGSRARIPQQPSVPVTASNTMGRQELAMKALQEASIQNPNINVAEIMSKLTSPMTANQNDASMAMDITNALAQALVQYRLQKTPEQSMVESTAAAPAPPEPSIPGIGSGTSSASSTSQLPSFLRTTKPSGSEYQYSSHTTTTQSYSYPTVSQDYQNLYQPTTSLQSTPSNPYLQTSQQQTTPSNPYLQTSQQQTTPSNPYLQTSQQQTTPSNPYLQTSQQQTTPSNPYLQTSQQHSTPSNPYLSATSVQSTPSYQHQQTSQQQSLGSSAQQTRPYRQESQVQAPNVPSTVLQLKSPVSQLTYSQAAKIPSQVPSGMSSSHHSSSVTQQSSSPELPDKLLESIRKQTEMLKQRLASINSSAANKSPAQPPPPTRYR